MRRNPDALRNGLAKTFHLSFIAARIFCVACPFETDWCEVPGTALAGDMLPNLMRILAYICICIYDVYHYQGTHPKERGGEGGYAPLSPDCYNIDDKGKPPLRAGLETGALTSTHEKHTKRLRENMISTTPQVRNRIVRSSHMDIRSAPYCLPSS